MSCMASSDQDLDEGPMWNILHSELNQKPSPSDTAIPDLDFQASPFAALLNLWYIVEPRGLWKSFTKYKSCLTSNHKYTIGDYVWVNKHPQGAREPRDEVGGVKSKPQNFWVARILEIRASDDSHVYARVVWMYWPNELPKSTDGVDTATGRRSYHGKYELVASNFMDIIDVTTFAGSPSVDHWVEEDHDANLRALYWRQTFDFRSKRLSPPKKYCVCEQAYKPDTVLLACPNPSCNLWLHAQCIIENALAQAAEKILPPATIDGYSRRSKTKKRGPGRPRKPYSGFLTARISDRNGIKSGKNETQVEISDLRPGTAKKLRHWYVDIVCLDCGTELD